MPFLVWIFLFAQVIISVSNAGQTCRWHHHEAHVEEVCKGQIWLQDVLCTGDLKAIAVTSQTWLRAVWAEEEVEITNSKADYIFADAGAAEKLPEPPAQPSEAQLLELLKDIKGVYEAKPSRHVQGRSCCNLEMGCGDIVTDVVRFAVHEKMSLVKCLQTNDETQCRVV